jgi:hypothetical protein
VDGHVLYSGESPDVVCHEHGHAVLDSLRPELFDAPFIEAAAFHEAFGDMSSILCALQLGSVRESLIKSTKGRIHRNSMVSRLAEQLGWAIRQDAPDAVDRDALRNAANTWFYQDPAKLPPSAPASQLCSEPHSFSRVFSGAFLYALSGMLSVQGKRRPTSAHLLQVTKDARRLLREAAAASPVVPGYFSQFAAHMVSVDSEAFGGRYRDALTGAFVRHGILSLPSATALTAGRGPKRLGISGGKAAASQPTMKRVAITGEAFGLPADVIVPTPSDTPRFRAAAATPDLGSIDHPAPERAAASFVEDLFRRGRIDLGQVRGKRAALANPVTYKSHELIREDDGLVLRRRLFDCGLHAE